MMNATQTAALGGACGALTGFAIAMVIGVGFLDTLIRVGVLGVAGAWIGMMLCWLNQLLPQYKSSKVDDSSDDQEDQG
ncbi:MAG: hypothetical protein Q9M26_05585 [Mariprofundales bacterium]|nr:hypothetical protein [Mariprofundales bacterium]